jgi:hypothetical protein
MSDASRSGTDTRQSHRRKSHHSHGSRSRCKWHAHAPLCRHGAESGRTPRSECRSGAERGGRTTGAARKRTEHKRVSFLRCRPLLCASVAVSAWAAVRRDPQRSPTEETASNRRKETEREREREEREREKGAGGKGRGAATCRACPLFDNACTEAAASTGPSGRLQRRQWLRPVDASQKHCCGCHSMDACESVI